MGTNRVGQIDTVSNGKRSVQGRVIRVDNDNVDGAGVTCRERPGYDVGCVRNPTRHVDNSSSGEDFEDTYQKEEGEGPRISIAQSAVGRRAKTTAKAERIVNVAREGEGRKKRERCSEGDGKDNKHEHSSRYMDMNVPTVWIN